MATLKLNNTPVLTEVEGVASLPSSVKFPAGHVIQVKYYTQTAGTSTTLEKQYIVGMTGTITTKESNSKIFVMADAQGYSTGTVNGANIAIKQDNNDILITNKNSNWTSGVTGNGLVNSGDMWMGVNNSSGLANYSWSRTRFAEDDPQVNSGTVMSYSVMFGKWGSAGTVYFGYTGDYSQSNKLIIMEISQ